MPYKLSLTLFAVGIFFMIGDSSGWSLVRSLAFGGMLVAVVVPFWYILDD